MELNGRDQVKFILLNKELNFFCREREEEPDKKSNKKQRTEPPLLRQFSVNGELSESDAHRYYFVPVRDSNNAMLAHFAQPKKLIMFHAPRGGGKSTRIRVALSQLQERGFTCLWTSLRRQKIKDVSSADFWYNFGTNLATFARLENPNLKSPTDFTEYLKQKDNASQEKIILIVDEFDKMYQNEPLLGEFLGVLRALKPDPATKLWGFIAVGPFSIVKLYTLSESPFNVQETFRAAPFTREQVQTLFEEFATEWKVSDWSPEIADYIYDFTAGHPGFVCFCGKKIQTLLKVQESITYEDWLRYVNEHLLNELRNEWTTVSYLHQNLMQHQEAMKLLEAAFLHGDAEVVATPEDTNLMQFLAAEGLLVPTSNNATFRLASPLVRNLALSITPIVGRRAPSYTVLSLAERQFDLVPLLGDLLQCFDADAMKLAKESAYKLPRCTGAPQVPDEPRTRNKKLKLHNVPSEACYYFELFLSLRQWMHPLRQARLYCEANCPIIGGTRAESRRRCDIVLKLAEPGTVIIELVASEDSTAVQQHVKQALQYGDILGASQIYVVHFFVSTTPTQVAIASSEEGVNLIHIHHDLNWTTATIYDGNQLKANIKLN